MHTVNASKLRTLAELADVFLKVSAEIAGALKFLPVFVTCAVVQLAYFLPFFVSLDVEGATSGLLAAG